MIVVLLSGAVPVSLFVGGFLLSGLGKEGALLLNPRARLVPLPRIGPAPTATPIPL